MIGQPPGSNPGISPDFSEDDIARYWWNLLPGSILPLSDGRRWRLLYAGRTGGSQGPDIRDAVLCSVSASGQYEADHGPVQREVERYAGDIEFHIRAADWFVHEHHTDPRYNAVILHVVSLYDKRQTLRQDGLVVPICTIHDLPLRTVFPISQPDAYYWPCHTIMRQLDVESQARLLDEAGLLRFEQKTHMLLEQLHTNAREDLPALYDRTLLPALAEGLGYGRDRAFFRAVGLKLAHQSSVIPEPLGRLPGPAPLDAARLRVLMRIATNWGRPGIWVKLYQILSRKDSTSGLLRSLRGAFQQMELSLARTDILICNVILPFAAAIGLLEGDRELEERARALYLYHPGLASNQITRMMSVQLLLPEEPQGSCRQQGLHYIYQQTCREKRCEECLFGKRDI